MLCSFENVLYQHLKQELGRAEAMKNSVIIQLLTIEALDLM